MGLVPAGGGGDGGAREALARACHFCGEPSVGPCAFCRLPICPAEACSAIFREEGLAPVVLCADCAGRRPRLAAHRATGPALLALGAIAVILALTIVPSAVAGATLLGGVIAAALGATAAVLRWQWRSRLSRARGRAGDER